MAFKFFIFAATLAVARAGNLIASAPAAVAYSSAPAVSSAYFHQASAPIAHAAPIAYAAQAPVAVAHSGPIVAAHSAPVLTHAVHAPSVGYSEQNVARSLGGGQSVSTYSKAVDSAFSSVRKYDTRITNDALSLAPAPTLVAKSFAGPVAYSQPLLARSYAAPAQLAYHAPAHVAYSAPVIQNKNELLSNGPLSGPRI